MRVSSFGRGVFVTITPYAVATLLCLLILVWALRLWEADLAVPFNHQSDSLLMQMWIKSLIDNGWYLHNSYVGAPAGLDMHDYPLDDNLHFALLKLIALVCGNWEQTYNAYFLLTFPLTTWTSLFVLRRVGVSFAPALLVSLLYTFLPYHYERIQHLFLASYYLIPLGVMILLWIYQDVPPLVVWDEQEQRCRWHLGSRRSLGSLVICLLIGSGGIYYAFFCCFFLLLTGAISAYRRRMLYPFWSATGLVLITGLSVAANLPPSLLYARDQGGKPGSRRTSPGRSRSVRTPNYAIVLSRDGSSRWPIRFFQGPVQRQSNPSIL